MIKHTLTATKLHELLDYDVDTGIFRWRKRPGVKNGFNDRHAGQIAGCINGQGYRTIRIMGRLYQAARLAFLYVHGRWPYRHLIIDHANGNKHQDNIGNIRETDPTMNSWNSKIRVDSSTGAKGVDFTHGRYRARIQVHHQRITLGFFDTVVEAAKAYDAAAKTLFGAYAVLNLGESNRQAA